jgi:hypothetical protein
MKGPLIAKVVGRSLMARGRFMAMSWAACLPVEVSTFSYRSRPSAGVSFELGGVMAADKSVLIRA